MLVINGEKISGFGDGDIVFNGKGTLTTTTNGAKTVVKVKRNKTIIKLNGSKIVLSHSKKQKEESQEGGFVNFGAIVDDQEERPRNVGVVYSGGRIKNKGNNANFGYISVSSPKIEPDEPRPKNDDSEAE